MSDEPKESPARPTEDTDASGHGLAAWRTPILLFLATLITTSFVGAEMHGLDPIEAFDLGPGQGLRAWMAGWDFALPLMSILLAHELGHYVAGRLHRVDISPPYFIPMPLSLLGTMGAVIRMRGRIARRDALLDVGASGPLAGLAITLPVLIYGIATSPVEPLPESGSFIVEGRSLLYVGLLYALKGPIPEGHDIMLSATAFAGWAGLLVTMINLVPVGQLDGGHIAYALFGKDQDRYARMIRFALPAIALVTGAAYGVPALLAARPWAEVITEWMSGLHWMVWFVVLTMLARLTGHEHPPTDDDSLSPTRRLVAIGTLVTFVLLFMPWWVRPG
ncbi:MAG: site-2 protease family protein [Deltaproteobacteria bacterium]|nr:site-2 protease family protein [Deltaproteobacteria bacterium]